MSLYNVSYWPCRYMMWATGSLFCFSYWQFLYIIWATVVVWCELLAVSYDMSYSQCRMMWVTGSVLCSVNYRQCHCMIWATGSASLLCDLLAVSYVEWITGSVFCVSYWPCPYVAWAAGSVRDFLWAIGSVATSWEQLTGSLFEYIVCYWQCR